MKSLALLLAVVFGMAAAQAAQSEITKAEIFIENRRNELVTLRFAIALRAMRWSLIDQPVTPGDDLTYRFPVTLPYCENMENWGIHGVATITSASGEVLCEQPIRLCQPTKWQSVVSDGCRWTENVLFKP